MISKDRLFGIETEYALSVAGTDALVSGKEEMLSRLMRIAARELVCLPGRHDRGLFTENGSRFYVDCGLHPEWATPECSDPRELVRYIQAGERNLIDLLGRLRASGYDCGEVLCFKSNVDYGGTASTWGCHESYLHRADPGIMPAQIVPHLVTRQIYTGAGGFDSLSNGLDFTISPRVPHLDHVQSGSSTGSRGIFHDKNESLSKGGYHRLHLLCGESLCSETASWLKIGTTALIVLLIEAGLKPGATLQLQSPLKAMRDISRDLSCGVFVPMADGRSMTAIQVQREYLHQVVLHLHEPYMPEWAEGVCTAWENILDRLASTPQSVAQTLDWAIKHSVFRCHAESRGFTWEDLAALSRILTELNSSGGRAERPDPRVPGFFLSPAPLRRPVDRSQVEGRGVSWETFSRFLDLRVELLEIDMRFGQLGSTGIFEQLDKDGVLEHRVSGLGDVERSRKEPPERGRARIRGYAIRQLAGKRATAGWTHVDSMDEEDYRFLDLSEPFVQEERWKSRPRAPKEKSGADETGLWEAAEERSFLRSLWRL